jgi:hypothetical protein
MLERFEILKILPDLTVCFLVAPDEVLLAFKKRYHHILFLNFDQLLKITGHN